MAKKQKIGACQNKQCENFEKEVKVNEGEELLCPICHQPLEIREKKSKGFSKTWIIVIVLFILLLGVGGYLASEFFLKDTTSARSHHTEKMEKEAAEGADEAEDDGISFGEAADRIFGGDEKVEEKKDEAAEAEKKPAEKGEKPAAKAEKKDEKVAPKAKPAAKEPEYARREGDKKENPAKNLKTGKGTVNLGYAVYSGDLKNGKPHGFGKLTFKTSHKLIPSKDYVAKPGDTFEGDFRDGRIVNMGYWKHNGETTLVKP